MQMKLETCIPRPEYPRPQMVRKEWINLNGEWEFEVDYGNSGKERKWFEKKFLNQKIIVPFCPESKLSKIENKDFMNAVWYRREFEIPDTWFTDKTILHFGAVDYLTEVWINGISVGKHHGGYSSFSFDITNLLKAGKNTIFVCAQDDVRTGKQPRGKQSSSYFSKGCNYTRTTGIWQTVWLEKVPNLHISSLKVIPDPENACVHITACMSGVTETYNLITKVLYEGKVVGEGTSTVALSQISQTISLTKTHLWEPGNPNLYDLTLSLRTKETTIDYVESYFGLRSVSWNNRVMHINGKSVFQRLVLDQGFYPDGIYTAPSDEALKNDIKIAMELGFNGARLHQKIFEPRYLYWADKLGYLVWGEHGNWGLDITTPMGLESFLPEWIEALERDFNHPSIVGWCPFNETWDVNGTKQDDEVLRITYQVTKSIDGTRPVIDTSGHYHVITDIYDIHDYEQNVETFAEKFEPMKAGGEVFDNFPNRQKYEGQPYFVSEYGGIKWDPEQKEKEGWGYGDNPKTKEEFIQRYEGLTHTLLENPNICAFCYTQLYDVEQEVNGLYTYDRKPKFDPKIFREINSLKAAIEK
jgi:beta-galactosidase/beta-glucuronidase